jgi:sugar phosphate isomerase/epimerase
MSLRPLEIGVIIGHNDPMGGIAKVKALGLNNCQMGVPDPEWRGGEKLAEIMGALRAARITVTTVFCGFPGESYADIPTIHSTVGLVPPALRNARLEMAKEHSNFARELGVGILAAHIGFVPDDEEHPDYQATVKIVQDLCEYSHANHQKFALETGQETAKTLIRFIRDVNRPNLGVNFDPANMMMYGSGDPMEALELVGPWVIGAHAKDGDYPETRGTLGKEYPLGQGKVDFRTFIKKLREFGYTGPLTIEREISGEQQLTDIREAIQMLEKLKREA